MHVERPVIRLFGPLAIEDGSRLLGPGDLGGSRPKQVLEILLAARGHRVPVDRLAELLWSEGQPQNAAGSLQTFVSTLRRRLACDRDRGRQLVVTEPEAYRFAAELVTLDLDRFDELMERSAGEPTHAARASLEEALRLVRGDVLEDEPYAPWALDLRRSFQGRVLGARLDAADAALAELDYAAGLTHADAAVALDRLSERAQRSGMLALYALGRSHEALDRYRAYRQLLDDELGLEPATETRALEGAVIRQEDVRSLLPRPIGRAGVSTGGRAVRLLGRAAELDVLVRTVRGALDGSAALIRVEGEPGLGKTRLLDEVQEALAGVRVGRASCSELEQHLPYVPLATALRDALHGEAPAAGHRPGLGRILPELASGEPEPEEVTVLEALVALVAEHGPLVLLVDDVQWADPQTVAALAYLRRRAAGTAVALVVTTRAVTPAAGQLDADLTIRLDPLTRDDLERLGIPGLHESTGGNPRFVVEALVHGPPGPTETLTQALAARRSRTLADAVIAECRALGEPSYRILLTASALDQPFEPEPLADLLGVDAAELTEELERLCEQRILRVEGFRFRFRYDLVAEVLAQTVSPARRRLLHRRLSEREDESTAALRLAG